MANRESGKHKDQVSKTLQGGLVNRETCVCLIAWHRLNAVSRRKVVPPGSARQRSHRMECHE